MRQLDDDNDDDDDVSDDDNDDDHSMTMTMTTKTTTAMTTMMINFLECYYPYDNNPYRLAHGKSYNYFKRKLSHKNIMTCIYVVPLCVLIIIDGTN